MKSEKSFDLVTLKKTILVKNEVQVKLSKE